MQKDSQELYTNYQEITQKAADLQYAAAVLGWDQEVYMPPKGFPYRGRQLATLATQAHELMTSENYGALLYELSGRDNLNDVRKNNVRLSLEDYEKNKKLPPSFIDELTQQTSRSFNAWIKAREGNNYSIYQPELDKMISLKRKQAELYGYKVHPYDALLDEYEKDITVAILDPIFEMAKAQLPSFLKKISEAQQVDNSFFIR